MNVTLLEAFLNVAPKHAIPFNPSFHFTSHIDSSRNSYNTLHIYLISPSNSITTVIELSTMMSSSISIHASSQNSPSIQTLHSSIQTLINSWLTRQKWLQLLSISTTKLRTQYIHHQDQNFGPNWRTQLVSFLESTWVHMFTILLLVLDLLITILELSNCHQNRTQEEKKAELGFIVIILHWVGIGILGLLSVKTVALMVGLGWSFFRHGGYVVDGSVVIGALVLEGFLEKKGGGLVVTVVLWRVIRVIESAFELSDEAIEAQIEAIICQFEAISEENRKLLDTIQQLKDDLDRCCCQSNSSQ